jgi:tRNA pseudouridine38-40 synthase
MRIALGLSYLGRAYEGWQSQLSGRTIQDHLESALLSFTQHHIRTHCAGRTDAKVHALMQVVHFDSPVLRDNASWVRGLNSFLPEDIGVQWAAQVEDTFDARKCALSRKYIYLLLESAVRPSLESGRVGWSFKPLDAQLMIDGSKHLLGTHDFSSFRAAACQALSPIKTLSSIKIGRAGAKRQELVQHHSSWADEKLMSKQIDSERSSYWRFEFEGNAFLHHMIRNIMGCLIYIGQGKNPPSWMREVLLAKSRDAAAPTFAAEGLYFAGPRYDPKWGLPQDTPTFNFLP